MEVMDMGRIKKKWRDRAGVAGGDYKEGVQRTKKDWATETGNAEESYEIGVQSAIADKRFGKGVDAAGTGKWKRKAIDVGSKRFGPGVAAAEEDFEKGFAPYLSALQGISLPPRYPRGDVRNIERVRIIAETLNRVRVGG